MLNAIDPGREAASDGRPAWLAALAEACARQPWERKVLVCARRGMGREALRRLALESGGWVSVEVATPLSLALELVAGGLERRGLAVADEFEEAERIDASIDAALAAPGGEGLLGYVGGAGLRDAMANSVRALRLAGIDAAELGRIAFRDGAKREAIGRVLAEYERRLWGDRRTDRTGVFRHAAESLRVGAAELPAVHYLLFPGLTLRGLAGALVELLVERGATMLPDDPVRGLARPAAHVPVPEAGAGSALSYLHAVAAAPSPATSADALELFAASSVGDEVREVFRRVVAGGHRWDEVEIVATDPLTYGAAVDSLARRLGVPVTFAAGLPMGRTRPGRAVDAYLRWLAGGLPEDILRAVIDRGDIVPPEESHGSSGPALARRLRRLRIGRGLERYDAALERARRMPATMLPYDHDLPPEEYEEAVAVERRVVADLDDLLRPVLDALRPLFPEPRTQGDGVSAADVARGLLAFLARVPDGPEPDREVKAGMTAKLERLAETAVRKTTLEAALATVAAKIESRAAGVKQDGTASWRAQAGHLHVSDIEHGGLAGRRATFVVGLDAVRFPGAAQHDTLLGDDERRRLARSAAFSPLPTAGERLEERRWALAVLLARSRGRLTLSYSAWDAAEARTVAPAAEVLQALRLRDREPAADYDRLRRALGARASAVPRGPARIDAADVWLGSLAGDGVLLHGADVVRAGFAGLDAGLRAAELRASPAFTAHHGRIAARPGIDPRADPGLVISPSRLETLGTCPLRYLMRWVLKVRPPYEPEFRADRWLTPLDRGSLLHDVYRRALEQQRVRGVELSDAAFEDVALGALEIELGRWRERLPPPGEATFGVEAAQLADDVRAFVRMTRETGAPWLALEYRFGYPDRGPRALPPDEGTVPRTGEPVLLELKDGTLRLAGRIDRIDREEDGRLVVIDYKTGGTESFGRRARIFNRGRRLQHALYTEAVDRLLGPVARAEYHFPTQRGETQRVWFDADSLRWGTRIVNALLNLTAQGWFHPTAEAADCRYCDFGEVCRVRPGRKTESPLAEWSEVAVASLPELAVMRKLLEERER